MAKLPQLKVDKRELSGRKVKQLRNQGLIPANIYGKKTDSVSVQVDAKSFAKSFQEVGETSLVELVLSGEKNPRAVLVTNAQRHPVTNDILHVDFHQVELTEKVTASIPVEVIGESLAVKEQGGVMVVAVSEIEVEALPTDLPDKFEVDVSKITKIGDSITISDLKVGSKVSIALDETAPIVTVQAPQKEEEPEPVVGDEEAVEGEAEAEAPAGEEAEAKKEDAKAEGKPKKEEEEAKADDKKEDK